jgi:gamma-glutamylcysteine synthetase
MTLCGALKITINNNMGFKDFVDNYEQHIKPKVFSAEDKFFDVVGVKIGSLKEFTAWLILNNKIKPYVSDMNTNRPYSLFNMHENELIGHFVKQIPNLKELSESFSNRYMP